jgi:ATP-dependent DNA helicase RecG
LIKFDPRALMERAVEAMRSSIAEPRDDGKISPRVGAVLAHVGDQGPSSGPRVTSAHRGEFRRGDHAEFTLLERKNRDRALDDCILFATLEPCAPGARRHPKLGCAERIVLARIKQVWIGIEDPDPTVARKGIEFLRKNGVEINMFDRDLQEVIEAENRKFLDQALQRAGDAKRTQEKIVLSTLEGPRPAVIWDDLSSDALSAYRESSSIKSDVADDVMRRTLEKQGLLTERAGVLVQTGFGNILFGTSPRDSSPQAAVLGTIHNADGTEDTKDFDGPQVLVPGLALDWIKSKLPNAIDRSGAIRKEKNEVVYTLIREGLVNAIVHRDYDDEKAKCQLIVRPSRVQTPGTRCLVHYGFLARLTGKVTAFGPNLQDNTFVLAIAKRIRCGDANLQIVHRATMACLSTFINPFRTFDREQSPDRWPVRFQPLTKLVQRPDSAAGYRGEAKVLQ